MMFALLIMGTLFGFVGVLIAVPLVAAIAVLLRELWIERMDSLGTDPEPPPHSGSLSGGGAGCGEPQEAAFVPELPLGEEIGVDPTPPELLVLEDRQVQRQRRLEADEGELVQGLIPRRIAASRSAPCTISFASSES